MSDITPLSQLPQGGANPVDVISAMLSAEKVTPDPKEPAPAQPEGDAQETGSNNAEVEGQDAEPEQPAGPEIPLDQLEAIELEITVRGDDGKDVIEKPTVKELKAGYMKGRDYQYKTKELARERDAVPEKIRQGIESQTSQYLTTLQQLEASVIEAAAPELKNVDWDHLASNDQFEYIRLRNRADKVVAVLNNIKSKVTEVTKNMETQKSQATQKAALQAWAELEARIPGWNRDTYTELINSPRHGVKLEVVSSWTDASAIEALYKFDKMQSDKSVADKKVVNAPKVVKAGATSPVPRNVQRQQNALDRFRKSGGRSQDDLAAFLSTKM